ncbi:MAG TPA: hypothetical protein VLC28_13215, partial [Flavitalea sp.]|nr:hypothetical protein [Flavitalea sp.]
FHKTTGIPVSLLATIRYLRTRYDTRTIERYEGPCTCPEEVSLTSRTANKKLKTTNNFLFLPAFGTTMPVQQQS